jgi:type I restriction enzyme, R subunit
MHNADTYAYFGEPVYVYSLKEGINDGFLTPFRVVQVARLWMSTPTRRMTVWRGRSGRGRRYEEGDFNRVIVIQGAREEARRNLSECDQPERQEHRVLREPTTCLLVRDLINQLKTNPDPTTACG